MGDERYLTVKEAAERLRVSPGTVYALCAARQLPHARVGDPLLPALVLLRRRVSERLENSAGRALALDVEQERLTLRDAPHSLRGAVWLQFARAIDENRGYRRCRSCAAWMEIAPGISRSDRLFCSDACRTRAHRERKHQAQELYAAGEPVEAIAAKLDTDVTSVRKWLGTPGGEGAASPAPSPTPPPPRPKRRRRRPGSPPDEGTGQRPEG